MSPPSLLLLRGGRGGGNTYRSFIVDVLDEVDSVLIPQKMSVQVRITNGSKTESL